MNEETRSGLFEDVSDLDAAALSASAAAGGTSPMKMTDRTDADQDSTDAGDADGTDAGDADGTDAGDTDGTDAGDADGTDASDADGSDRS